MHRRRCFVFPLSPWKSKDKYGRVLGTVFVGGKDINLQMVRDGYAHHYKRFDNSPMKALILNGQK